MEINKSRLRSCLEDYDHIIMYGCGNYARLIYPFLAELGRIPDCCVVTDKNNCDDFFEGIIPVCTLEEKVENIKKDNVCIIVAVSEKYEKQIEQILQSYEIFNYLLILDFDRNNIRSLERYKDMDAEECIKELAQWRAEEAGVPYTDIELEKQKIKRVIQNNKKNRRRILFVLGVFKQRSLKIAGALQRKGYEVRIFAGPGGRVFQTCLTGLAKLQIPYIECKTIEELMYRMIMEQAGVVHLFTEQWNSRNDRILIQMKSLFPPVVYDEYDIMNEMYIQVLFPQDTFENERFCLEHAEAICNRGYEIDYLKQECNYHICAKTIQFHDYCSDVQCKSDEEYNGELNLCYTGGLPSEEAYYDSYVKCFMELAEQCRQNECHFHIYPAIWDENRWAVYMELEKQNEFFHMHKTVPFEQLKLELRKFDYGVFPMKDMELRKGIGIYTKQKMVYSTANKYFDYLDAGLPVIAASPIKLVRFLEEKGVLINWTVEQFDFDELRRRRSEIKKRVLAERETFQIQNHINELTDFYNSLEV